MRSPPGPLVNISAWALCTKHPGYHVSWRAELGGGTQGSTSRSIWSGTRASHSTSLPTWCTCAARARTVPCNALLSKYPSQVICLQLSAAATHELPRYQSDTAIE